MATDEDTELRDLVAQTLEANGVLGKIRAQLRSSVFLALEEQDSLQDRPMFVNRELKNFLSTKEGQTSAGLVREFLEYFKMEFTLAVFDPESGCDKSIRKDLARDCGIPESDKLDTGPLLLGLFKGRKRSAPPSEDDYDFIKVSREISDKDLSMARSKFQRYDLDHDGFISRDELHKVFNDLHPKFPRSMLDAYVNDECRKGDKDLIGSNEFMKIYKQVVQLCRSVVTNETAVQPTSTQNENAASEDSTLERKNKKNKSANSVHSEKSSKHVNGIEYEDSEPEEDPFFDDLPLPKESSDSTKSREAKSKGMGSARKDKKTVPKKIPDFGFDIGDDDYDDDFVTNSNMSNKPSARSEHKTYSIGEEIDESIEEDISGDDDKSAVDETTDHTVSINEISGFDYVEDVNAALP